MASTIGNVYIRIGADTKQLSADLKAAQKQMIAFGRTMKSAGAELSQNLTLPILAVGAGAVKAFGDLEALQKGLIAVMGSASAANVEFEKLKEVAKLPGLGLEEAVKGSVNLQSAGFSADQAREALLQFGNALATVGKGRVELDRVVLALTQLQNKTGGFGQDLKQLVEQLPQLRTALTNSFGTADSEAISDLGVTGKQVVEILITEFSKLPRVSGGIKNAFENLTDSTKIAFAKLGETLNKNLNIEGFLNRLGDTISRVTDAFAKLSPQTQKAILTFVGIAAAIGPILFVTGQLAGSFSAIIALMKTAGLAGTVALGPVGIAIAAIAAAVAILYIKWEDMKETMDQLGVTSINLSKAFDVLKVVLGIVATGARLIIDLFGIIIGNMVRLAALVTGRISWKEFADSSIDAFTDIGARAADGFTEGFREKVKAATIFELPKISIEGGSVDKALGFLNNAIARRDGGNAKTGGGKTKKVDQFSELPEDVAITAGIKFSNIELKTTAEIIGREVLPELDAIGNRYNTVVKSQKDANAELQKMKDNINVLVPPAETLAQKLGRWADEIRKAVATASQIFSDVFAPIQGILDAQNQSIDVRRANEKRAVEESITNEDEKAKRLAAIDQKYDAEKRKIQRRQAIANKVSGIFDATIAAALGIANALKLGPIGIPLAALMGALGGAQIAAIAGTPLPSLAIGTNRVKSDGLANIHKGEAIVPAKVVNGGFNIGNGGFVDRWEAFIEGHVMRVTQRNSEFYSQRLSGV